MITLISNIAPILLGFFGKLLALKSQASSDLQKLQLEALMSRNKTLNAVRNREAKESPWSALNRRIVILVILGLVIFTQVAPVLLDVPTVIPTIREGFSFLGLQFTPDVMEYITVDGMLKLDEVFSWGTMIIEFMFGATIAKGK